MKHRRKILSKSLIFVSLAATIIALCYYMILSASLFPDTFPTPQIKTTPIVQYNFGGKRLCIPENYLRWRDGTSDTITIQTMYPDFVALEKRPREVWKDGDWWKQVRFLMRSRTEASKTLFMRDRFSTQIDFYGSTVISEQGEYGLEKRTKPEGTTGARLDRGDVWLEKNGDEYTAFIGCSKKHTETTTPQCQSYFWNDNIQVTVSHDKRLLPHWREIKTNIIALINEFDCSPKPIGE